MNTDSLDELAAFGHATDPHAASRAVTDFVERNPVPAVLAAAAAGAALMALAALMTRRAPDPLAPVPVGARGLDYELLRQQIADLADRVGKAAPRDAAKQRVERAGDAISDGWGLLREQALDALDRFEPQASAAVKVLRENPGWTALVVGAVGALVGSQLLGKPAGPSPDAGADV